MRAWIARWGVIVLVAGCGGSSPAPGEAGEAGEAARALEADEPRPQWPSWGGVPWAPEPEGPAVGLAVGLRQAELDRDV
ncbi:MAG: hypothetical protein KDK70_26125, partial [Myxococcales bacterium]|nr:hypothetical protein [Myxococcales bacterium]